MRTRVRVDRCSVCWLRPVKEGLPVCSKCWEGLPAARAIEYFAAVKKAAFTPDPKKSTREAESRVLFLLRCGR